MNKAKIEDIQDLVAKIPDSWALCQLVEGTSQAFEAEYMVAETLHACAINHKTHGIAFSWRGDGVQSARQSDGTNNGSAYAMLLDRKYFVEENRDDKVIIVITQKLVDLLREYLAKKTETAPKRSPHEEGSSA